MKLPTITQTGISPSKAPMQTQILNAYVLPGSKLTTRWDDKINISRSSLKYITAVGVNEMRTKKIVELNSTYRLGSAKGFEASDLEHYEFSRYGPFNYHQLPILDVEVSIANNKYLPGMKLDSSATFHDILMKEFHEYTLGGGVGSAPLLPYSNRQPHSPPLPRTFHFVQDSATTLRYYPTTNEWSSYLSNLLSSDITSYRRNTFFQPKIVTDSGTTFELQHCALKSIYLFPFTKKPGSGRTIMSGINSIAANLIIKWQLNKVPVINDYNTTDWSTFTPPNDDLTIYYIVWVDGIASIGGPEGNIVISA